MGGGGDERSRSLRLTSERAETPSDAPTLLFCAADGTDRAAAKTLHLDALDVSQQVDVCVPVSAADVGRHRIAAQLSYALDVTVGAETFLCECSVRRQVDLDAVRPFSSACRLLSFGMEQLDRLVFGEECLLSTELKVTATTPLRVYSVSWNLAPFVCKDAGEVERPADFLQLPVTLNEQESYTVYSCIGASSWVAEPTGVGELVLTWSRANADATGGCRLRSALTLPAFSLEFCPVLVKARLPARALVRAPCHAAYELRNLTDVVLEVHCALDSSDTFMFAGEKQVKLHLLPMSESCVSFKLLPLISGVVQVPRFRISSPAYPQDTFDRLSQRGVPLHLFVLPSTDVMPNGI